MILIISLIMQIRYMEVEIEKVIKKFCYKFSLFEYIKQLFNIFEYFMKEIKTPKIIENIMGRIRHLIGDGNNNTFSFMNGGFVRKHIKVILKNLKDAFGKNIYSVAVCLNIAGCSLILSISFKRSFI